MPRPAATADVFRAISDPTRRALLDLLRAGERNVSELAAEFDVSLPAVSQHLKVLRDSRLVRERRGGRQRYYRLDPQPLREVAEWIADYERFWLEKLDALDDYLKRTP
jgi:DNA-binding transcriptional ArsR family regulator